MKIVFLIGNHNTEEWLDIAEKAYLKKISFFLPSEIKRLKAKKTARDEKEIRLLEDSKNILSQIKSDDFVVLFDEKGRPMDSIKFSKEIERILIGGKKRLVFIIGGPYGVNSEVKNKSNLTISLSTMVFNNHVAELVTLEQVYRAFTLVKGIPYHNS